MGQMEHSRVEETITSSSKDNTEFSEDVPQGVFRTDYISRPLRYQLESRGNYITV